MKQYNKGMRYFLFILFLILNVNEFVYCFDFQSDISEQPLYCSSRLGIRNNTDYLVRSYDNNFIATDYFIKYNGLADRIIGRKQYEHTDHLGNVRVVFGDRLSINSISGTLSPEIFAVNNYYPFGMIIKSLSQNAEEYRFGFGGHEKDDEIKGIGNHLKFGDYGYDTRLGRRWRLDPVDQVSVSNYAGFANNPILFVDIDGMFTTKFGAWLYNIFHGGKGEILRDKGGEYFVSTQRNFISDDNVVNVVATRIFDWQGRKIGMDLEFEALKKSYLEMLRMEEFYYSLRNAGVEIYYTDNPREAGMSWLTLGLNTLMPNVIKSGTGIINTTKGNVTNVASSETHLLGTARDNLLNMVQNPKLKKIVNDLYRPGAKIGGGSSMDAFRLEQLTGVSVGGKTHGTKLIQYRKALQKLWKDKHNLSDNDKQIVKQLLDDIQNALSGN